MQDDRENEDPILDMAIHYVLQREYPDAELTKDQKRAVRKRAATLLVDKGEVYLQRKGRKVKVISSAKEQMMILSAPDSLQRWIKIQVLGCRPSHSPQLACGWMIALCGSL